MSLLPALSPPSATTTPSSSWKTAVTPMPTPSSSYTSYSPGGPTRGSMRIPSMQGLGLGLGLELPSASASASASRIPVLVKPKIYMGGSATSYDRSPMQSSYPSPLSPQTRPRSPSGMEDASGRKSPFHHQHRERSLSVSSQPASPRLNSPLRPCSPLGPGPERGHSLYEQLATRPPRRMQLASKRSVTAPYIAHAAPREIPSRRPSAACSHASASSLGAPSSFPKHMRRESLPLTKSQRKRASSLVRELPGEGRQLHTTSARVETAEGSLRGLLVRGQSSPAMHRSRPDARRVVSARPEVEDDVVEPWLQRPPATSTPAVRILQTVASSAKYSSLARRTPSHAEIPVLSLASPSPSLSELSLLSPLPPFQRSVTAPVFRHASSSHPLAPLTTLAVQQTAVESSSPTSASPGCDTPRTATSRSQSPSPGPAFDARRAGYALRLGAGYVSFGDVGLECPFHAEDDPEPERERARELQFSEAETGTDEARKKWWQWTIPKS